MTDTRSIGGAISVLSGVSGTIAGNVASSSSGAGKRFETHLSAAVIPNGKGGYQFSSLNSKVVQRVNQQGEINSSSTATHVAINGDGMFIVCSTDPSSTMLSRLGTFSVDSKGDFVNTGGFRLKAWKLDDQGRLPGVAGNSDSRISSDLGSLDVVNIKGLSGKPKATDVVSIDMRLSAAQDVTKGAGEVFAISSTDPYNSSVSDTDVIVPSGSLLRQGDNFTVQVDTGTAVTYTYGGVSSSFNVTSQSVFGQTTTSGVFNSGLVAGAGVAVLNDGINIQVGATKTYNLTFVSGAANNGLQFNSLDTLKNAINKIPELTARIVNNTLFVAAKDGHSAVSFTNSGATSFVGLLGLSGIAQGGPTQFSTIGQLRTLMQQNPDLRVAKPASGIGVDISVANPTSSIKFTSTAPRINAINYVTATQTAAGDVNLRKIDIVAPNHGLKAGDMVNISGLALHAAGLEAFGFDNAGLDPAPNGIYYVTNVTAGSFEIAVNQNLNIVGGPGVTQIYQIPAGINPTWQKTTGSVGVPVILGPGGGNTIAAAAPSAGATATNQVTITAPGLGAIAANDIVYVHGIGLDNGITVPDGYYTVTAVAAGNITINVPNSAGAIVAAGATTKTYIITKVGTNAGVGGGAGAPNVIATSQTFIASPTAGVPATTVRVNMPDNGFAQGDYFSFAGTVLSVALSDIANKAIKITAAGQNWFEFDAATLTPHVAADFTGLPNAGALTAGAFIDYFGKFDSNVSFDQSKNGTLLNPVYNASVKGQTLASGNIPDTVTEGITVYDSLGVGHNFVLAFAKMGTSKWACEIFAQPDSSGKYSVTDVQADGVVAAGMIEFDGNGVVQSVDDALENIPFKWTNSSGLTSVKMNWGQNADVASTSLFTNGGLKHLGNSSELFSLDQNGYSPGNLINLTVDAASGNIIANFDNGQTQAVYTIPIGYVASYNDLTPSTESGSVYNASFKSGVIVLKKSGENGVGTIVASALEGSNVDNADETANLVSYSQATSYAAAAYSNLTDTIKDFLRRV